MQDCFRQHPDVYGAELEDEEDGDEQPVATATDAQAAPQSDSVALSSRQTEKVARPPKPESQTETSRHQAQAAKKQVQETTGGEPLDETPELVPKATHDTAQRAEGK